MSGARSAWNERDVVACRVPGCQQLTSWIAQRYSQRQVLVLGGVGDLGGDLLRSDLAVTRAAGAQQCGIGVVGQRVGLDIIESA